jgi:hypothetical protein
VERIARIESRAWSILGDRLWANPLTFLSLRKGLSKARAIKNNKQASDGLSGKYSAFTVAGASIGVVAPAFKEWSKTFWENLGASIQLHNIKKVIVVNHRDCGAAKIAYGEAKVATPAIETETHKEALLEFRRQLKEKFPALGAQLGLMALDGTLETFS